MNSQQRQFLDQAKAQAEKANHPFAAMTACEAALESNYGLSQLAREANNLFGMKKHAHETYGTMHLPTREWENSEWREVTAAWVCYPDWRACFCDRLCTLERLSNALPHYKAAIDATDPETYVRQVSQSWSTDPGFVCSCGQEFYEQTAANAHAGAEHHTLTTVPGLGRALKVLAIYRAYIQGVPATPAQPSVT